MTQRDSDAFSVYSFELTENMTFISGPFGETIKEEEENDTGSNNAHAAPEAPPSRTVATPQSKKSVRKNSSKPSTPKKMDMRKSNGLRESIKEKSPNGKRMSVANGSTKVRAKLQWFRT